jgi:hypothetical protein
VRIHPINRDLLRWFFVSLFDNNVTMQKSLVKKIVLSIAQVRGIEKEEKCSFYHASTTTKQKLRSA